MRFVLVSAAALAVVHGAAAQDAKPPATRQTEPPRGKPTAEPKKPATPANQPQPPQAASEELRLDKNQVSILIKSTVLALHHANLTGNYSVLRDLGTPVFREKFDQVRLAQIFADLRTRKINLSVTSIAPITLAKNPEYTKDRELKFSGFFNTAPLRIQFELSFFQIDNVWRIAGMAVDALPAQNSAFPQAQAEPGPAPPPSSDAASLSVNPAAQVKPGAEAANQLGFRPDASPTSVQIDLSRP
ncbi:MAG: hypothetical protein NW215_15520 [Hyphomicrobiales bacterium]|nr:hypothetical protein [Hyphomicrobiales bacterium]